MYVHCKQKLLSNIQTNRITHYTSLWIFQDTLIHVLIYISTLLTSYFQSHVDIHTFYLQKFTLKIHKYKYFEPSALLQLEIKKEKKILDIKKITIIKYRSEVSYCNKQ